MHIIDWAKEHPYLTGSVVLGLFVLVLIMRRSGGSASASAGSSVAGGPSESMQMAQLNAGTQLQLAQLAAGVDISKMNATINLAQLNDAADIQKLQIGAGVQLQNILSGAEVEDRKTDATLTLGLRGYDVQLQGILSAQETAEHHDDSQLAITGLQTSAYRDVNLAGIAANLDLTNKQTEAYRTVNLAGIAATQDVTNRQTAATLQAALRGFDSDDLKTNSGLRLGLAQTDATVQLGLAQFGSQVRIAEISEKYAEYVHGTGVSQAGPSTADIISSVLAKLGLKTSGAEVNAKPTVITEPAYNTGVTGPKFTGNIFTGVNDQAITDASRMITEGWIGANPTTFGSGLDTYHKLTGGAEPSWLVLQERQGMQFPTMAQAKIPDPWAASFATS